MGESLSFVGSKSHYYIYQKESKRNARADENFARENAQLFSMGLIELSDEGIPEVDSDGKVIETYTNKGKGYSLFKLLLDNSGY